MQHTAHNLLLTLETRKKGYEMIKIKLHISLGKL